MTNPFLATTESMTSKSGPLCLPRYIKLLGQFSISSLMLYADEFKLIVKNKTNKPYLIAFKYGLFEMIFILLFILFTFYFFVGKFHETLNVFNPDSFSYNFFVFV